MNIKEAKQQLKNTIRAYLAKDEYGDWRIPVLAQRPVLLMGAPGIGKTAIAHQVAQECGIGIVAYTITHHTRQSAIGLPSIQTGEYQGKRFSVTQYTMSEIIASVYEEIEKTGLQEGILFLDEINCVSETLAPTMLQFLQCKTFGNHKIPEGWVIIAAGNPPEYNRSVREFDIVTLDRVRRIDIEEDFSAWKEYAYLRRVHPAILSYLEIKPASFYRVESTVDGKRFVTARGWEDLSRMLSACELLELPIEENVIGQYLQYPAIAKDFASYLDLYRKYRTDYNIPAILAGKVAESTVQRLRQAPFDERLSAVSLLLDALFTACSQANEWDMFVTELHQALRRLMAALSSATRWTDAFDGVLEQLAHELSAAQVSGLLEKPVERRKQRVIATVEGYLKALRAAEVTTGADAGQQLRGLFAAEVAKRRAVILETSGKLNQAFIFMETVFGEGQELVMLLTELTMNPHSMQFIRDNGCEKYTEYNRTLLLGGREQAILAELNEL